MNRYSWIAVLLLIAAMSHASEVTPIAHETVQINALTLNAEVEVLIYNPASVAKEDSVTAICYIFGDFLFQTFAGTVQYLSREMDIIPNVILIGINEIEGKPINNFQDAYSDFITKDLVTYLNKRFTLKNDGVLFGHSRATRQVIDVMQRGSTIFSSFILSAPWIVEPQYSVLDTSLQNLARPINVFCTQSEQDLSRVSGKASHHNLMSLWYRHADNVKMEYHYFDGETHMSIPPLSFYYGVKHLLGQ